MARDKTHRPQHSSSARVRRAAHLEHDAEVKGRKRNPTAGERARRRIREARLAGDTPFVFDPQQMIVDEAIGGTITIASGDMVGPTTTYAVGPFRAPDVKVKGEGWQVLDASDAVVTYAGSRDKARALARQATAGDVQIEVTA